MGDHDCFELNQIFFFFQIPTTSAARDEPPIFQLTSHKSPSAIFFHQMIKSRGQKRVRGQARGKENADI